MVAVDAKRAHRAEGRVGPVSADRLAALNARRLGRWVTVLRGFALSVSACIVCHVSSPLRCCRRRGRWIDREELTVGHFELGGPGQLGVLRLFSEGDLPSSNVNSEMFAIERTHGTPRAYVKRGHGYINLETGTIEKPFKHSQTKFERREEDDDIVIYAETLFERKEVLRISQRQR